MEARYINKANKITKIYKKKNLKLIKIIKYDSMKNRNKFQKVRKSFDG